jgi:phosphotransferase system  glucose/maltose/N-acetylglucosamine-specific IIC component|tara:strand:+ start:269 stop:592 length:324 start_codon:yes stop_codon:yes gene_type:complete
MNAPTLTPTMLFDKSRIKYFLIMSQTIIIIVSIFKIINAQNETYWILTIVLSSLIFIFVFSLFEEKENIKSYTSKENITKKGLEIELKDTKKENIPDVLEDGWDLPI